MILLYKMYIFKQFWARLKNILSEVEIFLNNINFYKNIDRVTQEVCARRPSVPSLARVSNKWSNLLKGHQLHHQNFDKLPSMWEILEKFSDYNMQTFCKHSIHSIQTRLCLSVCVCVSLCVCLSVWMCVTL